MTTIPKSNLPRVYTNKYEYIVHSEEYSFTLKDWTITDGILSGKIKEIKSDKTTIYGNKIHLYFSSDSVIKIDKGGLISAPFDKIIKAELWTHEVEQKRIATFFIFSGAILAACLIYVFLIPWKLNFSL